MDSDNQISVVIPTFQAESYLPVLLDSLYRQSLTPSQVIIVDTCSTDKTIAIAQSFKCITYQIEKINFTHGRSRNIGASLANGSILVFLTQDALPVDSQFIEALTRPVREGNAVAASARQIAYPSATPLETFARQFNYPEVSSLRTLEDLPGHGIKTYFFSNSASAIQRDIFNTVAGFSEEIIVNEDMDFCFRLIQAGYAVAYQAEAKVYHSHNYSLVGLFRRYFDIGVYFSQSPLNWQAPAGREGKRFFNTAVKYLVRKRNWLWLPILPIDSWIKLTAVLLGQAHKYIPINIKRRLSGQPAFWENKVFKSKEGY